MLPLNHFLSIMALLFLINPAVAQEAAPAVPQPIPPATSVAAPAEAAPPVAAPGSEVPPQAAGSDGLFAPLPQEAPGEPATADATQTNEQDVLDNWKISIMFPVKDMRSLAQVLEAVRRRKLLGEAGIEMPEGLEGELGDLVPAAIEQPKEAPVYYLNSILYRTPQKWAIWLNGMKLTPEETASLEDITIESVTERSVSLVWETKHLSVISPGWEEAVKTQKHIKISEDGKKVHVTLYPNQSFVSRAMQVIEGKGVSSSLTGASDATSSTTQPESPKEETPAAPKKKKPSEEKKEKLAQEKAEKKKAAKEKAEQAKAKKQKKNQNASSNTNEQDKQ